MNNQHHLSAAPNVQRRLFNHYIPDSREAKASDYLHHLKSYLSKYPDALIIIYIRVSTHCQKYKYNLDTHETVMRKKLKKYKNSIVGIFPEVSSGWILNEDRWNLVKAVIKAKKFSKNGKKVVIATTSTDRFLRNEWWTPQNNILPTEKDFDMLRNLTCNIPLATLIDPDKPQNGNGVRSLQTKWGQKIKGKKGGRPKINKPGYKKQLRLKKLAIVRQLWREGKTLAQIAFQIPEVPKVTLWYWLKHYCKAV